MEKKKCSKCGRIKDINAFYRNKTVKSGLCARCKQCISEYGKKRKLKNIELRGKQEFELVVEKKCSKCGLIKDVIDFHKDDSNKDGLHSLCILCVRDFRNKNKEKFSLYGKIYYSLNKGMISKRKAEYYKKNKDNINTRRKKYRQINKEQLVEYGKDYYQNNKEKISKRTKIYREKNKYKVSKREKLYQENNKDKINERKRYNYKRNKGNIIIQRKQYYDARAEYECFIDKLTVDELVKLHGDGKSLEVLCRYCGKYFIPSQGDTEKRVRALNGTLSGDQYLYCSDNCKQACPVYNQKKFPKGFKKASSREVNSLVRQMCFKRDNWECQICGKSINDVQLHCHHIEGYTQNPTLGNDIDNVITLCKWCHKEVHKLPGCNYYDLRCKSEGNI